MFSHEHEVEMTRRYRKDHDVLDHEADDLLTMFDTLTEDDIWQYRYPDDASLEKIGVRGIYLGNYVRWDPKAQHEQMIASHGYGTAWFARTFDRYDHVDCFNYTGLHDQLKLFKHGYSKVTDQACREIRHGRLHRQSALALVRQHEQVPSEHVSLFCDWLGVTPRSMQLLMDLHRNREYWKEQAPGRWEFAGWSTKAEEHPGPPPSADDFSFIQNSKLDSRPGASYIIVGKGYP